MKKIALLAIVSISLMAFDLGGLIKTITTDNPPQKSAQKSNLSNELAADGLKEALKKSTTYAITELGKQNGFLNNKNTKIPLPKNLQTFESMIRKAGGDKLADDLILSMNSAASEAMPKTAEIFADTISKMSLLDAVSIVNGGDNAATEYFKKNSTNTLSNAIKPIIQKSMQNNSVAQYYDSANNLYKSLSSSLGNSGFMGLANSFGLGANDENLDDFVTNKALEGLFFMIAQKEAAIRANPIEQTNSILKQVFGK